MYSNVAMLVLPLKNTIFPSPTDNYLPCDLTYVSGDKYKPLSLYVP